MHIRTFVMGLLDTNCYLIWHEDKALAVDPGGPPQKLLDFLKQKELKLTHILLTHLHVDHLYGVATLVKYSGAPVLASPADDYLMQTELGSGGMLGLPKLQPFSRDPLEPGDYDFSGFACTVLATPGHSPGSCSFYFSQAESVLVGDLLFARQVGRTDFPGGDMQALLQSVKKNIFTLPGGTKVLPGHGPATTVAEEKQNNPFFVASEA